MCAPPPHLHDVDRCHVEPSKLQAAHSLQRQAVLEDIEGTIVHLYLKETERKAGS